MSFEIKHTYKFVLRHPKEDQVLEFTFLQEKDIDLWFPYLVKFEAFLEKEREKFISSGASVMVAQ